jgi:hypothetical protein
MHQPLPVGSQPLSYWSARRPIMRRRYVISALSLPCGYVVTYLVLRLTGVYYLFWNQGDWDGVDGSTGIAIVDRMFTPAAEVELFLQNRFHLTPPPSGG